MPWQEPCSCTSGSLGTDFSNEPPCFPHDLAVQEPLLENHPFLYLSPSPVKRRFGKPRMHSVKQFLSIPNFNYSCRALCRKDQTDQQTYLSEKFNSKLGKRHAKNQ